VEHCFLNCQYAKEFWRGIKSKFPINLNRKSFINPKTWLFEFLSNATELQRMVFATGVWHLWTYRNGLRNGEPCRHPNSLADQCTAYVEMLEAQFFKPTNSTRRETSNVPRWSPPPEGVVQIFSDAALFSPSRKMGIGVVIRSHHGECLLSCSELLEEVTMPEIAEAMALRRALSLASEEGFDKIIVASDCLSLILRINDSTVDRSQVGVLVQDIKALSSEFVSVNFIHVFRQCNVAAHTLARSAEQFISFVVRNSIPDCIRQTICNGLS
jgi:ribonuclease HI